MFEALKRHFAINLKSYDNINVNLEINKIVLGTFIVLILGVVILNNYRGNVRLMVMQLTRHNAKDEESAKTLKQLGLQKSASVKKLLSGDNTLTKIVARVGEVKYSYEEYKALSKKEKKAEVKINFDEATFYLCEDQSDRIANVLDKYNVTTGRTVATCALIAIFGGCLIACMPEILNIVNNLLK